MSNVAELRKEIAVCLRQLAFTLDSLDIESPTDIDIKTIEFVASICKTEEQKNTLIGIAEKMKLKQCVDKERPRHLSVVK